MKRIIMKVVTLLLIVSIISPNIAFAGEKEFFEQEKVMTTEAEVIGNLQTMSDSQLEEKGYSEEEIQNIRDYTIEGFLLERSQLPRETLLAYGYSSELIDILKEYDGSPLEGDEPILAAVPSCTGWFSGSGSTSSMSITFTWEWSSYPAYLYTDEVAVCWQGVNSSGSFKDTVASNYSVTIGYTALGGGASSTTERITPSYKATNALLTADIPMKKNGGDLYAKRGVMTFTVKPDGNYSFGHLNLGSYYVHATKNISFSISVDSGRSFSISPSVTSSTSVEIDGSAKLTSSGVMTNY